MGKIKVIKKYKIKNILRAFVFVLVVLGIIVFINIRDLKKVISETEASNESLKKINEELIQEKSGFEAEIKAQKEKIQELEAELNKLKPAQNTINNGNQEEQVNTGEGVSSQTENY